MLFPDPNPLSSEWQKNALLRQIDNTYILWFPDTKSFVLLEEPAMEVYRLFSVGTPRKKIKEICQTKFGHLEDNISDFVDEIIRYIRYYTDPINEALVSKIDQLQSLPVCDTFQYTVSYRMGNTGLSIRYQDDYFKFAIHPLISHLEVEDETNPNNILECFEQNDLLILTCNGVLISAFSGDDVEFYNGSVSQQIYSLIYQRGYNDWMMMLHASGISANQQAIVFSAAAGSGKSTISALLKAQGYGYLSDDFIAADAQGKVYPFPAAISVKEGAVDTLSDYYPELKSVLPEEAFTGKIVSYIPVNNLSVDSEQGYPIKAFVFVNYSRTEPYCFEEVETKEALRLLLKESWIKPTAENVTCFFDWLTHTRFYRLNYSSTLQAIETVEKIFES